MGITRATQSPSCIQRSLAVTRLRRRDVSQVRCLWWWGRKSRWWSSDHDDVEERLRRHRALMMHRYTKAMRRKSLWNRDDNPLPDWYWKNLKSNRGMSSSEAARAKVEPNERKAQTDTPPWREVHSDFESFKKAVDQALERDPYGALFGRRLRSPHTANNSSWTAWSWIFDPKEIKEEPKPESSGEGIDPANSENTQKVTPKEVSPSTESISQSPSVATHSSSSSKTTTSIQSSRSIMFRDKSSVTTEYVYDPISGRKVPQSDTSDTKAQTPDIGATPAQKASPSSTNKASSKGFLQAMFGEHGAEIPVKPYKPPKVYGFTGETKSSSKNDKSSDMSAKPNLENSRKREFEKLRLRTYGNNIDATNFNCEPWNSKEAETTKVEVPAVEAEELVKERVRSSEAFEEDVPLYSGTTYASKAPTQTEQRSDWLDKEGFRSKQGMTMASLKDGQTLSSSEPPEPVEKLQPAIDRKASKEVNIPIKKFVTKMQPAVDRIVPKAKPEASGIESHTEKISAAELKNDTQDRREDVDLLRASDVRAASKAARVTKQDIEDRKKAERQSLEKDYDARNQAEEHPVGISDKQFWMPAPENMGGIWKHIQQYPTGIVARTMANMGLVQPEKDKTQAVVVSEDASKKHSLATRTASVATIQPKTQEDKHFLQLGSELKSIYEQQHGSIHQHAMDHVANAKSTKPKFSEPTVKAGVKRDLDMERHTQVFEPQIANIVDKAKAVKRDLHEISLGVGDIVNSRAVRETTQWQATRNTLFDAPYILLQRKGKEDVVEIKSAAETASFDGIPEVRNLMTALSSLSNPQEFVQHFADLDKHDYDLVRGNGDNLVFRKRIPESAADFIAASSSLADTTKLRSIIANQELDAQPNVVKTATVLDELPASIPTPGPAAPTAPTTSSSSIPPRPSSSSPAAPSKAEPAPIPVTIPEAKAQDEMAIDESSRPQPRRSRARINRQEQVFSGQQRLRPQTTALPDPEHFQKQNPIYTNPRTSYQSEDGATDNGPQLGYFARLRRLVRRVVLTTLAVGVGAYGIGAVAEGLQARAQIVHGEEGGPMKRLVLEDSRKKHGERQRAGIFSTESSR